MPIIAFFLYKDVAKRHNVRNTTDLYNLATYLLSNFCNPISSNELAAELGLSSVATTNKFLVITNDQEAEIKWKGKIIRAIAISHF